MRTLLLTCLSLSLPLIAAESTRVFPLWDGKETVESYAAKVNLPATKSIDLGGGVKLDLVLIPAGQFIMGSAEPEKPMFTVAASEILIALGSALTFALVATHWKSREGKRKLVFSLRGLLAFTMAFGLIGGGIARRSRALKEAARYATEMGVYVTLPTIESPAHSVTLTQPFYMGKYTVTQEQYVLVMRTISSSYQGAQLPVEYVDWKDATLFGRKLRGAKPDINLHARLPTEAEWEYACRAGTRTRFYSGDKDSDLDKVGWYAANSGLLPHPVGQKMPNAFGLYDMHGNVLQWCQDIFDGSYKSSDPARDPKGATHGERRVLRGGTSYYIPTLCRAAARNYAWPDRADVYVGFRIVIPLDF